MAWKCFCGSEDLEITDKWTFGKWKVYATCRNCHRRLLITKYGIRDLCDPDGTNVES